MQVLPGSVATRYGFPPTPRPGQIVRDTAGTVWQWFPDEGGQLGELGFWGAILGAATGIIGAFKGSGDKKKLQEAEQIIQQQQAYIQQLEAQPKKSAGINLKKFMKKNGAILVIGLVAYMMLKR
jgi:hypothetical protein